MAWSPAGFVWGLGFGTFLETLTCSEMFLPGHDGDSLALIDFCGA